MPVTVVFELVVGADGREAAWTISLDSFGPVLWALRISLRIAV